MSRSQHEQGFTLIELAMAMAIAAILITAVVQLALATTTSFQLQQNLGALQENARFAMNTIQTEVEATAYAPKPWDSAYAGWSVEAQDVFSSSSDRLTIRRWSDTNCYENANSVLDANGLPSYYLRETTFFINGSKSLAQNCKYGPSAVQLTTQVNNLGLVEYAEALQFLFADDSDIDGNADRWLSAGNWSEEQMVKAVRVGLLLATPGKASYSDGQTLQVLDTQHPSPADGRIRRVFESTIAIRGRLK